MSGYRSLLKEPVKPYHIFFYDYENIILFFPLPQDDPESVSIMPEAKTPDQVKKMTE